MRRLISRRFGRHGATYAVVGFLAAALPSLPAQALPAFSQAYGVPCTVCHSVPPQLNAYGRYIQRTGYAALSRDLLKEHTPLTFSAQPATDTSSGSGQIEPDVAVHAAGYLSPDITFHIHQWIDQHRQPGGLDTFQFAYNALFKGYGHLFLGKLSNLPAPAPFSNQWTLAPYASAEMQVGEHMYQDSPYAKGNFCRRRLGRSQMAALGRCRLRGRLGWESSAE